MNTRGVKGWGGRVVGLTLLLAWRTERLRLRWLAALLLAPCLCAAQAIPVPYSKAGGLSGSTPTMTFLFEAKNPQVTLIFIPGGGGAFGMQADWTDDNKYFNGPYNRMLRRLTNPRLTTGRTNVVIFDSPDEMPFRRGWSSTRGAATHLTRVEDVARFYAARLGKPVWLVGHSAGSISISELYKGLQDRKQEQLIAGLIFSAGVIGSSFNYDTTRLPVLVLHHEKDQCVSTTPENAVKTFEKLKEGGDTKAELAMLKTGPATREAHDVCAAGYHMFQGAMVEGAQAIDQFIGKHLTPG